MVALMKKMMVMMQHFQCFALACCIFLLMLWSSEEVKWRLLAGQCTPVGACIGENSTAL
jgi:hypothetical protein